MRDDKQPKELIFVSYDPENQDSNPVVRCPDCGLEGGIMSVFSLLEHGFNGVEKGAEDDCGLQECGGCLGRYDDSDIWDKVNEIDDTDPYDEAMRAALDRGLPV